MPQPAEWKTPNCTQVPRLSLGSSSQEVTSQNTGSSCQVSGAQPVSSVFLFGKSSVSSAVIYLLKASCFILHL